jgi:hypothetical protein
MALATGEVKAPSREMPVRPRGYPAPFRSQISTNKKEDQHLNNPQVVICVSGGVIQEIFASDRDTGIVVVDWDSQVHDRNDPHVVCIRVGGRPRYVKVADFPPQPLAELAGTDADRAVEAAFEQGVLHEPTC